MADKNGGKEGKNIGAVGCTMYNSKAAGVVKGNMVTTNIKTQNQKNLSPEEIQELLRKRNCSDDTIASFIQHKVDGCLFMDLDEDMLKALNVTNVLEIRKLKQIKEHLSQGQE